jgi:hypothetical protein
MWCRDGVDGYMLKLNRFASFEMSDIRQPPQFAPTVNCLERRFREENRKPELALKDTDTLGVVAMVVTDQKSAHRTNVFPFFPQAVFSYISADPCVKQQADLARLHEKAISIASGLERNDFHNRGRLDGR